MKTIEDLMSPAKKLTELNQVQMKKAMDAQQATAKEYVSLAEKRFEAARGIKDVASFNAFIMEQVDLTRSGMDKMLLDSKVFLKEAKEYSEEVLNLIQDGKDMMSKK